MCVFMYNKNIKPYNAIITMILRKFQYNNNNNIKNNNVIDNEITVILNNEHQYKIIINLMCIY